MYVIIVILLFKIKLLSFMWNRKTLLIGLAVSSFMFGIKALQTRSVLKEENLQECQVLEGEVDSDSDTRLVLLSCKCKD